jgi:cytochrome c5
MGRIIQTWFFMFSLTPALWADEAASIKPPIPSGETVYQYSCAICYGADGEAVMPGVPDLTDNPEVLNQADAILIRKISQGFQSPGSSLAMPANGGNPQLDENDIRQVLDYMRETFQ